MITNWLKIDNENIYDFLSKYKQNWKHTHTRTPGWGRCKRRIARERSRGWKRKSKTNDFLLLSKFTEFFALGVSLVANGRISPYKIHLSPVLIRLYLVERDYNFIRKKLWFIINKKKEQVYHLYLIGIITYQQVLRNSYDKSAWNANHSQHFF